MSNQLPLEGILNRSIFAFENVEDEWIFGIVPIPASYVFILSSGISFVFIATGVVNFIDAEHGHTLTVKEKLVLMLIHLMKIGVSLVTCVALILIKSEHHPTLGFIIWLAILFVKVLILSTFANNIWCQRMDHLYKA